MTVALGLAIYFVTWWIVLFAVLPFGVRTQAEEGEVVPGSAESAPGRPRLVRVAVVTTAVATLVFGVIYVVITRQLYMPLSQFLLRLGI